MAEPTEYDLEQDSRIESLESLITAEYEPPEGVEYSFPVANQGVTQDQFRNMMRGLGKGTLTYHDRDTAQSAYRLNRHASDAETNQRNTLILQPAYRSGQAETTSNGFFHVLTEPMEIPLPAVTSTTEYHICVTYDPRKFKTDPLKIEVYPGTPPTSEGRDHIVLFTVKRKPNQLLSQAEIGRINQWLGHVINAWSYKELPDPWDVEYGTLAVVLIPSSERDTGPELYSSRGVHGWVPVHEEKKYEPVRFMNDWGNFSSSATEVKFTVAGGIVHVSGFMKAGYWGTTRDIMQLPAAVTPTKDVTLTGLHQTYNNIPLRFRSDGYAALRSLNNLQSGWICLDGLSYPINN